jgi:hypothetical protein
MSDERFNTKHEKEKRKSTKLNQPALGSVLGRKVRNIGLSND